MASSGIANLPRGPFRTVAQAKEPLPIFKDEDSEAHAAMEQSLQAAFAAAVRAETRRSIVEPVIQAPTFPDDTKGEILDAMEDLLSNSPISATKLGSALWR